MDRRLQCECGTVRGQLRHVERATHLMCYCKDCQAFARFLGKADDVLDEHNGSDIIVAHPENIEFSSGTEQLACMSLSDKGMLRWYARCCNTPIGNTGRSPALAYMGMSSACLRDPSSSIESAFGPVRMRSFTDAAKGSVAASGIAALPLMLGFGVALLKARLSGSFRRTPFFKQGVAIVAPQVLASAEYQRLRALS